MSTCYIVHFVLAGIPAEVQRLIYAGRQLEDEQTLSHYSVERGTQLDHLASFWAVMAFVTIATMYTVVQRLIAVSYCTDLEQSSARMQSRGI